MSSDALRQSEQVLSATMMFVSPKSLRLVRSARWRAFRENRSTFAEMLDVLPLIAHMSEIEDDAAAQRTRAALRLLALRQDIMQDILLATFDVSCASVEVRCEQARADRPADQLEQNKAGATSSSR